jgi:hypothetical protein
MQVFHERDHIVTTNMKTIKLRATHSMAMVCKTAFESVNDKTIKHKRTWIKIKFHNTNVK